MNNYIVDDIGKVVAAIKIADLEIDSLHYMYGHRVEIAKRLSKKNQAKEKYPLIALRLDTPENFYGGVYHYRLNILIVQLTKQTSIAEERYTTIFKPLLYPLYERFMNSLQVAGFSWDKSLNTGSIWPQHVKVDRPYWGVEQYEGNVKNIFADPLDAIEIIDLEVNQRLKTC